MKNEAKMNAAQGNVHKASGVHPKPHTAGIGPSTRADMKGVQEGGSRAEANGLSGAVKELKRQHPIHHMDRGPHHGDSSHVRHEPIGKVYK